MNSAQCDNYHRDNENQRVTIKEILTIIAGTHQGTVGTPPVGTVILPSLIPLTQTIASPSKVNVTRCNGQKLHKCIKSQYMLFGIFAQWV